ncbi:MAG TPA: hypothetical protein VK700_05615 [Steroidobacteraceae bacterium]|nr:hypothetical protein [Steroidobacteraceae bacterium]
MNKKWLICILAASAGPSLVYAAPAQDPETAADVRCIAVGFRMAQADNPQVKSAGQLLTLYYLGRLEGHTTQGNVEDLIIEQVTKMDEPAFHSEATRCGSGLTAKGQQLTKISQDLAKLGQQLQPSSAPPK